MAKKDEIKNYAQEIERYHQNLLSASERHALEKAALDDPFLADALDGYAHTSTASADLLELEQRLAARVEEKETRIIPLSTRRSFGNWWKAAAVLVFIAGAAIVNREISTGKKKELAQTDKRPDS